MKLDQTSRLPDLSLLPLPPLARVVLWARVGRAGARAVLAAMGTVLAEAWAAHRARRRLAHQERALRGLDERLLRDIGAPQELIDAARHRSQVQRLRQTWAGLTDR